MPNILEDLAVAGWIQGPKETLEDVLERKELTESHVLEDVDLTKAHELTEKTYGFRLEKIPVFVLNASLPPWQGAVLWSYRSFDNRSYPVIQIRKKVLWNLCSQEELLAHELVHAARFVFQEPFFEEILAYSVSKSLFRRFLGPVFLFSWEAACLLVVSFLCSFFFVWFDQPAILWVLPILLGMLLMRLIFLQGVFFLAKKHLKSMGKDVGKTLLRLTDRQIFLLAWRKICQL